MLSRLRKFRALPPGEQRLFLTLYLRLLGAEFFIRTRSSASILAHLEKPRGPESRDSVPENEILREVRLLASADRQHPFRPSCLRKALVLNGRLRDRRIAPVLKIGIRLEKGKLHAHAWIEMGGKKLEIRENDAVFTPLERAEKPEAF